MFSNYSTGATQRMWALQKLRRLMAINIRQTNLNVNDLLTSPTQDATEDTARPFAMVTFFI